MPKIALLENVSFHVIPNNDSSYDSYKKFVEEKIKFIEINNTYDIFSNIKTYFCKDQKIDTLDIENCVYTKDHVIQGFYAENNDKSIDYYNKIMLVKRKIIADDTYTYFDISDDEKLKNSPYEYLDVTIDDIINIMKSFHSTKGVLVFPSEYMKDIEFTTEYDEETHTGVLRYMLDNKECSIKYLNLLKLVHMFEDNGENVEGSDFHKKIEDKMSEYNASHIYTQCDVRLGILNCYSEFSGTMKNSYVSKIIQNDVYGTAIVGLENHLNNDNRILELSSYTLEKIKKLFTDKYVSKNKMFCNIFFELENGFSA